MADIVKAIEKEKEYLSYRMEGQEPFHLADVIKECGFETLEAYSEAKRRLKIKQLNLPLIECSQEEIVPEARRILANQLMGVWFADSDITCVFNGLEGEKTYNTEYCQENNIPVYSLGAAGGTIVHQQGDFSWGIACPVEVLSELQLSTNYFLEQIKDILKKYTNKIVTVDNNDILIDEKKVCGTTTYQQNNTFLFISYYSFNDKANLISKICNKDTTKLPIFIDFIDRNTFKEEVKEWLQIK